MAMERFANFSDEVTEACSGGTTPGQARAKFNALVKKTFALVVALTEFLPCREFIWGLNRLDLHWLLV